jgi:hypothetical protein
MRARYVQIPVHASAQKMSLHELVDMRARYFQITWIKMARDVQTRDVNAQKMILHEDQCRHL